MKKSTLFIFLAAILIAASAYYFDWKHGEKEAAKTPDDATKSAFSIQSDEIQSLTISYPADPKSQSLTVEKRDGIWQIIKPLQTGADPASIDGIVQGIATARVAQTEPGGPDRLRVYGLDPPAVGLDFQLKNGAKHSVQLGKKDFTGASVYSVVDNGKEVALLPASLLVSSDKPLQVLRDQSVLHIDMDELRSFDLKNASGEIAATKEKSNWELTKPAVGPADSDGISALFTALSIAKVVSVESETPDNLSKYGLANPTITLSITDSKGKIATLLVGKKDGDEYFARDTSRPTIFRINQDTYKRMAQTYADLRDKKIVRLDPATITRVEIHNGNGTIVITRKGESDWVFDDPASQKGKSASADKLFTVLDSARADQTIDHPTGAITAALSKPEFQATLTSQGGKKVMIEVSKEMGDFVYARSSDSVTVYKLKKQFLTTLNFKPSDMSF